MTTLFKLWFQGGSESITVKAPKKKGLAGDEEIDGLQDFAELLSSLKWFYSDGRLIQVANIDFVTLVREKNTDPVDD